MAQLRSNRNPQKNTEEEKKNEPKRLPNPKGRLFYTDGYPDAFSFSVLHIRLAISAACQIQTEYFRNMYTSGFFLRAPGIIVYAPHTYSSVLRNALYRAVIIGITFTLADPIRHCVNRASGFVVLRYTS